MMRKRGREMFLGRGKRDGWEMTVRWPIHCLPEIQEMLWELN
jgi:hypothetical protein